MKPSIFQTFHLLSVSSIVAILTITGLMACSASKQVTGEQITFTNASIQVNGKEFGDEAGWTASGPARGILALTVGDSATFLISERMFEGSQPTAQVSDNRLEATWYDHSITIQSEGSIHPKGKAHLWVRRDPQFHVHSDSAALAELRSYWADSYAQYINLLKNHLSASMGLDPERVQIRNNPTERRLDYFQEPKLIGGIQKLMERVEYREEARRNGIEGSVIVRFIIGTDGTPNDLEVIQGIGGKYDEAAIAVVREAKFEPAMVNGKPVRVQFTLPVRFGI